jgi:hypothetical protein
MLPQIIQQSPLAGLTPDGHGLAIEHKRESLFGGGGRFSREGRHDYLIT